MNKKFFSILTSLVMTLSVIIMPMEKFAISSMAEDEHIHSFDYNGYCSDCGYQCEHSECEYIYNNYNKYHQCKICFQFFEHEYSPQSSEFIYDDSTNHSCIKCGYTESHQYDEHGYCAICGKQCEHSWEQAGVGYYGHTCIYCGASEPHQFDSMGYCMICNQYCYHYYCKPDDYGMGHICEICKMCFPHTFDMMNGYCSTCGYQCLHNFGMYNCDEYRHRCDMCSYEEEHSFISQDNYEHYCEVCNYTVPHQFDETGRCMFCNYQCEHTDSYSYSNDKYHMCMNCNMEIPHKYNEKGICEDCGYEHIEHQYTDGVCTVCGISKVVDTISNKAYYQSNKNDKSTIRFIAEIDIDEILAADTGKYIVETANGTIEREITTAYTAIRAGGKLIEAHEGKYFVITNAITNIPSGSKVTADFILDGKTVVSRSITVE